MSDAVPAWAYEKAEVVPHDLRLADRARTERDRLTRSLAPWLVDGVEKATEAHVASLIPLRGQQARQFFFTWRRRQLA